jgi:hypothetical protein
LLGRSPQVAGADCQSWQCRILGWTLRTLMYSTAAPQKNPNLEEGTWRMNITTRGKGAVVGGTQQQMQESWVHCTATRSVPCDGHTKSLNPEAGLGSSYLKLPYGRNGVTAVTLSSLL